MKKSLLLLFTLLLLTACQPEEESISSPFSQPLPEQPRLENDLSTSPEAPVQASQEPLDDRLNITDMELKQGWYYGNEEEKKYATPESWVWQRGQGDRPSRFIHPDFIEREGVISEELLCQKTAGTYLKSCNQLEVALDCEYIPKSSCQCPAATSWESSEGCLKVDGAQNFILVDPKELEQGYYSGLSSERKKGTPPSWIWNAKQRLWQSPFYYPDAPLQ